MRRTPDLIAIKTRSRAGAIVATGAGALAEVQVSGTTRPPSPGARTATLPEHRLTGEGVAPGVALGRPCFLEAPGGSASPIAAVDPTTEGARVIAALAEVRRRLARLAREAATRGDVAASEVFEAHAMILADDSVAGALHARIAGTGAGAGAAVTVVFGDYVAAFENVADDYLSARAADFAELKAHLLDVLGERRFTRRCRDAAGCAVEQCALGNDHILVGGNLDAQIAARVDTHTRGFIVATGSARSHGALIARALGIPAIAGITDPSAQLDSAGTVLVDGNSGAVIVNPSAATFAHYAEALSRPGTRIHASAPLPGFRVLADLDRAERVEDVLAAAADGIGLYRTELEVLARGHLLDEDSQEALYARVVRARVGGPVCIRLFDLGYDKAIPELRLDAEDNPALGLRGARLLLERPEILRTQARAIARASRHGPVQVLYPMIDGTRQFLDLKRRFEDATAGIGDGSLTHGVMLEVPSACLQAESLLAAADFARIGTSDLTQYLFAIDREHSGDAFEDYLSEPALWDLLSSLVRTARRARKPLSACGVVAGNTACTGRLIRTGFREVSVEPRRVDAVRRAATRALA